MLGFVLISGLRAQSEDHKWKALLSGSRLAWYDGSQLDTITSGRFEIWVIELHKPAIDIDGVAGKVTRTKSLYCVDREAQKYGLEKIVYYNNVNTELARYVYESDISYAEAKYSFPIMNNDVFNALFQELDKKQGKVQ